MKLHKALPQSYTPENLAIWIKENSIEPREHEEKIDYTEEEIQKFEHDSAKISIELAELDNVKKSFDTYLKKGTFCSDPELGKYDDQIIRIPGTKGVDILKANRDYASEQIKLGYKIDKTTLYGIPYSAERRIIFFDIEGNEWDQYSYKMNPHQVDKYSNPLFDEKTSTRKNLDADLAKVGMTIEGGDGSKENPVVIKTGKRGPTPSEEDQHLFDS